LAKQVNISTSESGVRRALDRLGFTRKKKLSMPRSGTHRE
jgi:transposase